MGKINSETERLLEVISKMFATFLAKPLANYALFPSFH